MTDGMLIARSIRFLGLCIVRAAVIIALKPRNSEEAIQKTIDEAGYMNIPQQY